MNVIAELPGKNTNNVVMAGATRLSPEGPGINDNGSGSAAILETALMMAKLKPQNTIRFAWWGDEEGGLIGSTAYVDGLSQAARDRIALYMNYDMIGSPNYIQTVYDADQSTFEAPVAIPDGSTAIEDLYESYYTMVGEPYDDSGFDGRSDYQAFIENDIPSGGLFTGAEEIKTAQQQAIWGGTTGAPFDPCYHLACDTFANNNAHALTVNSDLVAFAQLTSRSQRSRSTACRARRCQARPRIRYRSPLDLRERSRTRRRNVVVRLSAKGPGIRSAPCARPPLAPAPRSAGSCELGSSPLTSSRKRSAA